MDRPRGNATPRQQEWGRQWNHATGSGGRDGDRGRDGGAWRSPPRQAEPPFALESGEGRDHAWKRHVKEGIWKSGKVLTDHETRVAVFASEGALDDAIAAMPVARAAWRKTSGRWEATVGDVRYYGDQLGDTMSLQTCFPLGGREYPKAWLADQLAGSLARSAQAFWRDIDEADELYNRLGPIATPPDGAHPAEREELQGLADAVAAHIRAHRPVDATRGLQQLGRRREAIAVLAAERAAREKAAREQAEQSRNAEINRVRQALNKAAENGDAKTARELYARMREFNAVVSPMTARALAALGIEVTDL